MSYDISENWFVGWKIELGLFEIVSVLGNLTFLTCFFLKKKMAKNFSPVPAIDGIYQPDIASNESTICFTLVTGLG